MHALMNRIHIPPQTLLGASIGFALTLWFCRFLTLSYNFNVIWLSECAGRLWANGTMRDICFETNPPLNIFIYLPVHFANNWGHIPEHIAFPFYVLTIVFLATLAVYALAKRIEELGPQGAFYLSLIFLLAGTILTGRQFGERDHFVFLGTFVMFLIQYGITARVTMPRSLVYLAITMSGLAILIKPHYGLMIVIMLAIRLYKWRHIKALIQADSLLMASLTIFYIIGIQVFTPSYISAVLPLAAPLYAAHNFQAMYLLPLLIWIGIVPCLCWFIKHTINNANLRYFLYHITAMGALCVLIIYIQHKGWAYHYIPLYGWIFIGISLCALYAQAYKSDLHSYHSLYLGLAAIALTTALGWIPLSTPTHNTYQNYNLARYIDKSKAAETCNLMIFSDMRETQSLAYYSGCHLASRFAVVWFHQYITDYQLAGTAHEQEQSLQRIRIFTDMIAEDLARYQPDFLILKRWKAMQNQSDNFYSIILKSSPQLRTVWQGYTLETTLKNQTPDYYAGGFYSLPKDENYYEIYKRAKSPPHKIN